MDQQELKRNTLIQEKGRPCISIVVPTVKTSRDRFQNKEVIRKAVRKAKTLLEGYTVPDVERDRLLMRLEQLIKSIDFVHVSLGLGLFVSPQTAVNFLFPFTVKTTIKVADGFETRNLVHLLQYLSPYYILLLSRNNIRLFHAIETSLTEVRDGDFPFHYKDEYEYARPSIGPSIRSVAHTRLGLVKDKSTITDLRMRSFFQEADERIRSKTDLPLVIAATRRLGAEYVSESTVADRIVGYAIGSFDDDKLGEMAVKAWEAFTGHTQKEIGLFSKEFEEAKGRQKLAQGIQEVWEATHEGRGLHLLVDRNYYVRAYQRDDDQRLWLRPPKGKYRLVSDAVDDVIRKVLAKNGTVTFVENNQIKKLDHIALLLRY